jgi:hypothetical protein
MENLVQSKAHREAWNKGKLVGQKAPLRLRDIWANAAVALLANSVATGAGLYVLISILGRFPGPISIRLSPQCSGRAVSFPPRSSARTSLRRS